MQNEVYGVRHGYVGLMNDDIFQMQYSSVSNCVHTGGTILRTGRTDEFKKISVQKEAAKNLTKRGVNNLIVIGGDGSFRGIEDLHQNTPLNVIGVPGTIDNDMGYTDYTIGFDTACNTVLDAMLKLRDTITSHDRIMILEVMGRHCGDIALKTAVAGGAEYVIVPEAPADVDAIAASVKKGFDKGKTSTIIVLAEGRNDLKDELRDRSELHPARRHPFHVRPRARFAHGVPRRRAHRVRTERQSGGRARQRHHRHECHRGARLREEVRRQALRPRDFDKQISVQDAPPLRRGLFFWRVRGLRLPRGAGMEYDI